MRNSYLGNLGPTSLASVPFRVHRRWVGLVSAIVLVGCGAAGADTPNDLATRTSAIAGDYPTCTNGSNTGGGYGWDPSVTDPNGSHSCVVAPAASPKVAYGANGYPYCTNGSNTGGGYGWDVSVTDPNGSHSCLVGNAPSTQNQNNQNQVPTPAPTQSAPPVSQGGCSGQPLPTGPVPGTTTQYPTSGSLGQLPSLSMQASTLDIKNFVATVYDTFPVFAAIYEGELGLTKAQALAFMYADMSRESASGHAWRIDLETGQGGPGDAYGPFQAAVTNFTGGGYDSSIEDGTGLPVPSISQFHDPATSTYAGMKRLADGILNALKTFGPGSAPSQYLLGSLADHNTGWVTSANNSDWRASYGNETLRLMQGYLESDNLTSNAVFWTGEAASDFCSKN